MTHSNINRAVEIGVGSAMKKGTVIAEQSKLVRGRQRTFFSIRLADGSCIEQDARRTQFSWEFLSPGEALSDLYLDEAINSRLNLK